MSTRESAGSMRCSPRTARTSLRTAAGGPLRRATHRMLRPTSSSPHGAAWTKFPKVTRRRSGSTPRPGACSRTSGARPAGAKRCTSGWRPKRQLARQGSRRRRRSYTKHFVYCRRSTARFFCSRSGRAFRRRRSPASWVALESPRGGVYTGRGAGSVRPSRSCGRASDVRRTSRFRKGGSMSTSESFEALRRANPGRPPGSPSPSTRCERRSPSRRRLPGSRPGVDAQVSSAGGGRRGAHGRSRRGRSDGSVARRRAWSRGCGRRRQEGRDVTAAQRSAPARPSSGSRTTASSGPGARSAGTATTSRSGAPSPIGPARSGEGCSS